MKKYLLMIMLSVMCVSACKVEEKKEGKTMPDAKPEERVEADPGIKTNPVVMIETTKGNIEAELNKEVAPVTVENFINYVRAGFYDGTVFHRVIKNFMIQGGGFTPDMNQKPVKPPIKLESNNGLKNITGTLAMARTNDPDSATSQFFINTVDNVFLDYAPGNAGYAVFGRVIKGLETVKEIESSKTGTKGYMQDWPVEDVVIKRIYLKE